MVYSRDFMPMLPWTLELEMLTRKAVTHPGQCIKKQRHHFAIKVCIVKAMVFPVVIYGCESGHKEGWVQKNWCFWIVGLEKILRVPWTARRSNQSILKKINTECSLEGLMLKLKLQYFGHLMQRADSFKKTLMLERLRAGGGGGNRGWDG